MLPEIKTRKVSLSKWYKPWTWSKFIEEKEFYFTFNTFKEKDLCQQ